VAAAIVISRITESLRTLRLTAERARAETEAAHARLLRTLERIHEGFFTLDHEGRFTYLNSRALDLLLPYQDAATRAATVGKCIWDVLPAGPGRQWEIIYREAMDGQAGVTCEEYYPALQRWVAFRIYPDREGLTVFCRESRRSWTEPLED
jgi:PAS domain-containing protein